VDQPSIRSFGTASTKRGRRNRSVFAQGEGGGLLEFKLQVSAFSIHSAPSGELEQVGVELAEPGRRDACATMTLR